MPHVGLNSFFFFFWNGNLWNIMACFTVSLFLCISREIRSISRPHTVLCPRCTASGKSRQIKISWEGRKQAYAAEQLPPSAYKRSPTMQLGSHAEKNEGWGGGCFLREKTMRSVGLLNGDPSGWCVSVKGAWGNGSLDRGGTRNLCVFTITGLDVFNE